MVRCISSHQRPPELLRSSGFRWPRGLMLVLNREQGNRGLCRNAAQPCVLHALLEGGHELDAGMLRCKRQLSPSAVNLLSQAFHRAESSGLLIVRLISLCPGQFWRL
jgi:hypothetical protein